MNKIKEICFLSILLISMSFYYCGSASALNQNSDPSQPCFERLILQSFENGKKSFEIRAGLATLENRKFKYFRIGLLKIVNLKNVTFLRFKNHKVIEKKHYPEAFYDPLARSLYDKNGDLIFKEPQSTPQDS